MSLAGTVKLLHQWGRTSRVGSLGLPSIVSFLKVRLGRSSYEPETDPEIELIDRLVSGAPSPYKEALIMRYCRSDSFRRMGQYLGISKSSVGKLLGVAEIYIDEQLQKCDAQHKKIDFTKWTSVVGFSAISNSDPETLP